MNSKNQNQYSNMSQQTAEESAVKTLEGLGYQWHGGSLWKPPLGKSAEPLLDRITELEAENERLKNVAQFKEDVATTLRTQLEAAKQVANDCRIVADNAIAEAAKNQWQPIETAPKDGTEIIVGRSNMATKNKYAVFIGCVGVATYQRDCWVTPAEPEIRSVVGDYVIYSNITHWMPLPLPPTIQAEESGL